MAATREDINRWIETAKKMGASHVISVCDTFEWDDYPVYVMPNENLEEKKSKYDGVNMQKINEVIDINEESGHKIKDVKTILEELSTIEDLASFRESKDGSDFCTKFNLKPGQLNFLISVVCAERAKEKGI